MTDGRIILPGGRRNGPSPMERQVAAVQAELLLGRTAIRMLVALLHDRRVKKLSVSEKKIEAAAEAGYRISIRSKDGKTTIELVAKDAADPGGVLDEPEEEGGGDA